MCKHPDRRLLFLMLLLYACGPAALTSPPATNTPPPRPAPTPTILFAVLPPLTADTISLIFDDDGSADGTTALFYLLIHPNIALKAVGISYGEAHPQIYVQHVARTLESFGITDVPLGAGQDQPLAGNNAFPDFLRQSADEFWGLPVPNREKTYPVEEAAQLIVSLVNESPEPISVFLSGPSTNLAQALRIDPGIRDNIAGVYIMGGAIFVPGNIPGLLPQSANVVAEWNIYADPLATKEVLESGLDIYLVPLDATDMVTIGREDTSHWRNGGPIADMVADLYDSLMTSWGVSQIPIWDLMTATIMTDRDYCGFRHLHLDVTTEEGPAMGRTLAAEGQPNAYVCLSPDVSLIKQALRDTFSNSD